jgi:hypothetical protein
MSIQEEFQNSIESTYTSIYDAIHHALVDTDAAYQNIENQVADLVSEGRILEE